MLEKEKNEGAKGKKEVAREQISFRGGETAWIFQANPKKYDILDCLKKVIVQSLGMLTNTETKSERVT